MPKTTRSVPQISVADDIIAIKNAASLVAAQFHGHALRNAGSDHVADGRSPEVVRDATGAPGSHSGLPPRVVEAVRGDAVARPVPGGAGLGDGGGSTSLLIRQPVTYAKVTTGRMPSGSHCDRRKRRNIGKSDTIDAETAARSVLSGIATAIPKTADGAAEMVGQIKIARDTVVGS